MEELEFETDNHFESIMTTEGDAVGKRAKRLEETID